MDQKTEEKFQTILNDSIIMLEGLVQYLKNLQVHGKEGYDIANNFFINNNTVKYITKIVNIVEGKIDEDEEEEDYE